VVWHARECNRLCDAQQPFNDAVIRVYDEDDNVIETHEHRGELKAFGL